RLDYRLDMHGEDSAGDNDKSAALDVTPLIRSGANVGKGFHLGGELRVPFLGAAAVDGVAAPTVDARFLAAYLGQPTWRFAMHAGYKLGTKGAAVDQSADLVPGDRVMLGLSEFDAVLL